MLRDRDASGRQQVNPEKFPLGWLDVTTFIHSLGMKAGLYTSKSQYTCAGFNASCGQEVIDAATYASWGVDYIKEDSCGGCRGNDTADYVAMHAAIQASGRPMIQTDEGSPDNYNCSTYGGCGNAKRVGHDISPSYTSMQSLVDIASGLWIYAHNASLNPESGGWWNGEWQHFSPMQGLQRHFHSLTSTSPPHSPPHPTHLHPPPDLDMMQIGNGDFQCGNSATALSLCQTHFTLWCLTKAVLLIGSNVTAMSPATLSVYANADAISLNQDALGIAGRRVAIYPPKNASLSLPWDALAVLAPCDASAPTQRWTWVNKTVPGPPTALTNAPCAATDVLQGWAFGADGTLRPAAAPGMCAEAPLAGCSQDSITISPCDPSKPTQQWQQLPGGQVRNGAGEGTCLDIPYGSGPIVSYCACHAPGTATNQEWAWANSTARNALVSLAEPGMCLTLSAGPSGGWLQTADAAGAAWCLGQGGYDEGSWKGVPGCGRGSMLAQPVPRGAGVFSLQSQGGSGVGFNNNPGASGPWPHTRYLAGGSTPFAMDPSAPSTAVTAEDHSGILDDDGIGHVTRGGAFCLDLRTSGALEVWAVPLAAGRVGVALWNRSPAPDTVGARWAEVGATPGQSYAVRDVWAGKDMGVFTDSYVPAEAIGPHAVVLIILTPQ